MGTLEGRKSNGAAWRSNIGWFHQFNARSHEMRTDRPPLHSRSRHGPTQHVVSGSYAFQRNGSSKPKSSRSHQLPQHVGSWNSAPARERAVHKCSDLQHLWRSIVERSRHTPHIYCFSLSLSTRWIFTHPRVRVDSSMDEASLVCVEITGQPDMAKSESDRTGDLQFQVWLNTIVGILLMWSLPTYVKEGDFSWSSLSCKTMHTEITISSYQYGLCRQENHVLLH